MMSNEQAKDAIRILTIIGARPQFVKAAVVSRAIAAHNGNGGSRISEIIVHTGQHYDHNMSEVFFEEMQIPKPDYHLGICDCSHGAMTGRMLERIEPVLLSEKPDVVLVYGDTNSTLAGALAAVKLHIPVAHVEAGLRSFNMRMPEEVNRVLTDRVSTFLFCPTETAMKNLSAEGIRNGTADSVVSNVGDVMYDAALYYRRIAKPSESTEKLIAELGRGFYLATVHRAENTDDRVRLENIIRALCRIAEKTPVVLPAHPRTRKIAERHGISLDGLRVIDPVGYFDILSLLGECRAVFTDSGGLQKEAFFFGKRCVTLRDETEWVELVENGFNRLAGAETERIVKAEEELEDTQQGFDAPLYGLGDAGGKIVASLSGSGRIGRIL